jgi:hypothetical protein
MIHRLRTWLFLRRHLRACKRLQRIVERERASFRCEDYRRRRAAALKGIPDRRLVR